MKASRVKTEPESISAPLLHRSHNSRIRRTMQSISNHEQLRQQALAKLSTINNIFNRNQKQLCDFFMKYLPMEHARIDVKKIVDERVDGVRLIKNANKIYFGEVRKGVKEGEGIMIDDKGKLYEGYFEHNFKCGHGVEVYPNGNLYIGNFDKNKKHGDGQFYWFSLSPPEKPDALYVQFYDGSWWGGLPDGIGSHQKSNGDIYDGHFKNGLKHGKGEQYFFNGDSYKGDYVNGLPEGSGLYIWSDDSKYEGDFKQGLRSGHGTWLSSDGKDEYRGQYLFDKKSGYGEYCWLNRTFLYKGNFENDARHGYGELYKNGIEEYKGQWVNGKIKQREMIQDVSIRQRSFAKSPKSERLPSLKKLIPPSSAIIKRIKNNQIFNKNKSLSRSKSPKSNSKSLSKLQSTLALTKSKKKLSLQKTLKRRPISSVHNQLQHHSNHSQACEHTISDRYDKSTKFELLVKRCTKKNCGCNLSIPLGNKINCKAGGIRPGSNFRLEGKLY